jgi:hypothetical protein
MIRPRTALRLGTLAVATATVLSATPVASATPGISVPLPPPAGRSTSLPDLVNDFLYCSAAELDTMYPAAPFFVFDCMRDAPGSNG